MDNTKKILIWCGVIFVIALGISAYITHRQFARRSTEESGNSDKIKSLTSEADTEIIERLLNEMKSENIRGYLR